MISKIEKAKRYAEERDRFHFHSFTVSVDGENNSHLVRYENGEFHCDCNFFSSRGHCSHTMALEMIMGNMIICEPVKS